MQVKKILITTIEKTPDSHDSDDVYWEVKGHPEARKGKGYIGKSDGRIHVVVCPMCERANYSIQVALGPCYACGFDPNIMKKGGDLDG